MALDIYPAIDLKEGKAVRLFKGDMQQFMVRRWSLLRCLKIWVQNGCILLI